MKLIHFKHSVIKYQTTSAINRNTGSFSLNKSSQPSGGYMSILIPQVTEYQIFLIKHCNNFFFLILSLP